MGWGEGKTDCGFADLYSPGPIKLFPSPMFQVLPFEFSQSSELALTGVGFSKSGVRRQLPTLCSGSPLP